MNLNAVLTAVWHASRVVIDYFRKLIDVYSFVKNIEEAHEALVAVVHLLLRW